ncbi:hypothetical protein H7K30_28065 [Paenibacillus illinoisensis]|nr:hypothetical protein [Paenibacillus illinoisensis]
MMGQQIEMLLDELQRTSRNAVSQLYVWDEEQFTLFVEKRQAIFEQLESFHSKIVDSHREKIKDILSSDDLILQRMHQLKDEAGNWMQKQGKIRTQQNAYQHAYMTDGLFIDQRK